MFGHLSKAQLDAVACFYVTCHVPADASRAGSCDKFREPIEETPKLHGNSGRNGDWQTITMPTLARFVPIPCLVRPLILRPQVHVFIPGNLGVSQPIRLPPFVCLTGSGHCQWRKDSPLLSENSRGGRPWFGR